MLPNSGKLAEMTKIGLQLCLKTELKIHRRRVTLKKRLSLFLSKPEKVNWTGWMIEKWHPVFVENWLAWPASQTESTAGDWFQLQCRLWLAMHTPLWWQVWIQVWLGQPTKMLGVTTCNRLASHPGGVAILLGHLPFVWKNRLFRWKIKWNSPFHWKLFGKRKNTFRGIPHFSFLP